MIVNVWDASETDLVRLALAMLDCRPDVAFVAGLNPGKGRWTLALWDTLRQDRVKPSFLIGRDGLLKKLAA